MRCLLKGQCVWDRSLFPTLNADFTMTSGPVHCPHAGSAGRSWHSGTQTMAAFPVGKSSFRVADYYNTKTKVFPLSATCLSSLSHIMMPTRRQNWPVVFFTGATEDRPHVHCLTLRQSKPQLHGGSLLPITPEDTEQKRIFHWPNNWVLASTALIMQLCLCNRDSVRNPLIWLKSGHVLQRKENLNWKYHLTYLTTNSYPQKHSLFVWAFFLVSAWRNIN